VHESTLCLEKWRDEYVNVMALETNHSVVVVLLFNSRKIGLQGSVWPLNHIFRLEFFLIPIKEHLSKLILCPVPLWCWRLSGALKRNNSHFLKCILIKEMLNNFKLDFQ
jgi:hypothetical protein